MKGSGLVRIVGPMVPHTRKYRFQFGSGQAMTRKSKSAKRYGKAWGGKQKVAMSIHEATIKTMSGKYRGFKFSDAWVNVGELNTKGSTPVNRVPTVTISQKKRGRI